MTHADDIVWLKRESTKIEILCKKDKKEAFKCPWTDCNFLRHEWSNHTAKVYHHVKTRVNLVFMPREALKM